MNKIGISAAVVAAALVAGQASWSLTLTGNFGPNERDNFELPVGYTADNNASAGLLSLTATLPSGATEVLNAFCVDLSMPFLQGKEYFVSSKPFASAGALLSAAQITDIKSLIEIADPRSLDFGTEEHSAGVNLALWEIVYETSGAYSVDDTDGGSFWTGANPLDLGEVEAVAFANSLLSQITPGTAVASNNYGIRFLESVDHASQNLVTFAPVPLPAAGWGFVTALGALALLRRRAAGRG